MRRRVEVLRAEGVEGVHYALWDMTGWHRDYGPYIWRGELRPFAILTA